jgi:HSP20 family molecular chaperone IbpA
MAETEGRSLEVQKKKELVEKEEKTVPARYYVPNTDIYETENALTVVVEMPGVEKDKIDISIEDNVLQIEGHIDFASYTEMQPVYTEYNVGHYSRKFSLSSRINQGKISAEMKDGILTLILPKAEEAKPRKITIR